MTPVSVLASNESSTLEVAPLVSRAGIRKYHKSLTASMINNTVRRRKKTDDQVKYLRTLFHQLGGSWDGKMRREAMHKTGLSRIQIYKWFFDMKLQQLPKEKLPAPEERVSYPPSIIQAPVLPESSPPQPIFLVERVVRI